MNHFYRNQISQIKSTGKSIDLGSLPNGSLTNKEIIPTKIINDRNYEMGDKNDDKSQKYQPNGNFIKNPANLLKKDSDTNIRSRPPSVSKSLAQSRESSYLTNNTSKISNNTSIQTYLERRHQESQQKINIIRLEKFKRETEIMQNKPNISENSKKIIDKIIKREISRDPLKVKDTAKNSNKDLVRSTSLTDLKSNQGIKTLTDVPLPKSVEACQSYQHGHINQTCNQNTLLKHRDNRSTPLRGGEANLKRPASTESKALVSKNTGITNKTCMEPEAQFADMKKMLINRDIKHYNCNAIPAYPQEIDREQVAFVRNKLNDYYIEQINSKLISDKINIIDKGNKINQSNKIPKMESIIKRSLDFKKDSASKLFDLGKEGQILNAPIKLHDKNHPKKFNTIQAISIKLNTGKQLYNCTKLQQNEMDISLNKRKEDLRILKSYADNVSVNHSYENLIDRNIASKMADSTYDTIEHSIYNKKNIQRNQQEKKQEIPSVFKLDNHSKEYLINKMNTLNSENRSHKKI